MAAPTRSAGDYLDGIRQLISGRFSLYTSLSLITVPVGYGMLVPARDTWDINAGPLNLAVGTALTPPSFWLYRRFVWHKRTGKGLLGEWFTFWQVVMVAAGLLGQVGLFIGRYWLDRVTCSTPEA